MKILIVDDYYSMADLIKRFLLKSGKFTDLYVAKSSKEEIELLEKETFDVIITDNIRKNEEITGMDIVIKCAEDGRKEKFILFTASEKYDLLREKNLKLEFPENVIGFIKKPIDWSILADEIYNIIYISMGVF